MLAVIRGGAAHIGVKGRLDLVRSTDGGKTWSPPWTAIDGSLDDRNPAIGQLKDGAVVLAYAVAATTTKPASTSRVAARTAYLTACA